MKNATIAIVFAFLTLSLFQTEAVAQRPFERLQRSWDDIRPRGRILKELFGDPIEEARQRELQRRQETLREQQRRAGQARSAGPQPTPANTRNRNSRQVTNRAPATPPRQSNSRRAATPSTPTHPSKLEIETVESEKKDGLLVRRINPRGAAYLAGIRGGDIITQVGGLKVTTPEDLESIVSILKDGDQIEFEYSRQGKKTTELVQFGTPLETDSIGDSSSELASEPRSGGLQSVMDQPINQNAAAPSSRRSDWDVQPPQSSRRTQPSSSSSIPRWEPNRTPAPNANITQLQQTIEQQQRQIELLQQQLRNQQQGSSSRGSDIDSLLDFQKR